MKNAFVILLFFYFGTSLNAQTVNGIPLEEIKQEYIEIIGTQKMMSTKWKIYLNFGQAMKVFSTKDNRVNDENGKPVKFNSTVDALNFLAKDYNLIQAFVVAPGGNTIPEYHYLMQKKVN